MHPFRWFAPALLLVSPLAAQARVFRVDRNHTVLGFRASTLLFDVPGRFDRYKVDISGDPATLEGARIRVELETRSVNTSNGARDEHLRSPDFFGASTFPRITFTSTSARREGNKVLVRGTLDLHGVSRELELPFTAAEGVNGAGVPTWSYRAALPLDRLDFGIGAESVAAKISLKKQVDLELLLVGSFEEAKPAPRGASRK
ncbi:MAG: YceI family protein [Acidobacteria bacterium]|nr:YceI family protein [Acidobacteriota bacterium]